ncbi:MAG: hypothetical protein HC769_24005 [Cyanobacteria bacterium CRU_2_1]|nr:hypothetical protein [Cyanobacteria bacterium RU_5_0]NJR61625.1 hypothetical protein [Cyanobacteria bacterium CRU_2_1]
MYSPENIYTQLTFYYLNGHSESFNIHDRPDDTTVQGLQLEVKRLLEKDWWVLNLPEQTVMINISNVVKVEVKPVITQLHGDGVFGNAERVTALNRSR